MNGQPDMLLAAAKMILALLVCLGGIAGVYWLARRVVHKGAATGKRLVQVIENRPLGQRKMISLVQVPGSILVLGISEQAIQLLATIDPQDISRPTDAGDEKTPGTFSEHLAGLLTGKMRT
jgi:flagellar protein FliO/FliZ